MTKAPFRGPTIVSLRFSAEEGKARKRLTIRIKKGDLLIIDQDPVRSSSLQSFFCRDPEKEGLSFKFGQRKSSTPVIHQASV
jgi:hypothetical protein